MRRWVQIRPTLSGSWTDGDYEISIVERTKDRSYSISWFAHSWWEALIRVKLAIEEAARREQREEKGIWTRGYLGLSRKKMKDRVVLAVVVGLLLAGCGLLPERSPRGVLPLESKFVLILDLGWLDEVYGHTIWECTEEIEGIVCKYLAHNPVWPRPW